MTCSTGLICLRVLNPILTKFIHKWKYNQDGIPIRPKSRVVVQGFYEADTGADKAAPVASMESVHLLVSWAAQNGLVLKQADTKMAFLYARIPASADLTYVIPPRGFECSPEQARQVWLLNAWLYGLRLSPKGWNDTFQIYLPEEIGFVQSSANPCLYILNEGEIILLMYADAILFSGGDED